LSWRGNSEGDDDGDGAVGIALAARLAKISEITPPFMRSLVHLVLRIPAMVLIPVALLAFVRPFRRAARTQWNIIPILVQLRLFELRRFDTDDARLAAQGTMDARLSVQFAQFIGRMRGAFVKVAQILGSLDPPPVRQAYVEQLEPMTESAPGGRAWGAVERQITRELRRSDAGRQLAARQQAALRLSDVFAEFDPVPCGTASVGQVHRAVLRGSENKTVAVKLQYPDARQLILTDLGNIGRVLRVLGKKAEAAVVREYRSRMSQEFDYTGEARTMGEVADFFDDAGRSGGVGRRVAVPRPHAEWCTRRLIVMDYVEGRSLRESLRERLRRSEALPPVLRVPRLLSLRWEAKRKLSTLLEAQAAQIFRLGTFNADPHPGNVFLTPAGPLCLLDFGCHKSLSHMQRARLARLYVALAERDEDAIVTAAIDMGVRTQNMDKGVIVDFATHFFDRDVAPLSPPAFLVSLRARDRITSLPHEYMLVARSSLLLRGLGAKLRAPQQCARSWEREARRFLHSFESE
jgi:predicted unusual protein kinase regulating ubiquinone biosynthesis (AarF/ABC1/UbiB family)